MFCRGGRKPKPSIARKAFHLDGAAYRLAINRISQDSLTLRSVFYFNDNCLHDVKSP